MRSSNNDNNAYCVDDDGNDNNNHVNNNNGVRPASPRLPDEYSKRDAPVRGAKEPYSVLCYWHGKTHAAGETDADGATSASNTPDRTLSISLKEPPITALKSSFPAVI